MKTLVLNAGYEPMSVVPFRRAVVLVLGGKANVLEEAEALVRSEHLSMHQPSVIILRRYVRPPAVRTTAVSRRGVLRRDANRCAYCAEHASTVDHVLPRSRGGQDTWQNLVACCRACNNRKGSRTPEEMGWELRHRPAEPHGGQWWLRDLENPVDSWRPFLEHTLVA